MWFLMVPVMAALGTLGSAIPCEEARLKCMYREGCASSLHRYLTGCSSILQNPEYTYCPKVCFDSLVVLVSTEEGKALMECECSDAYCEKQKKRTEICRPSVMKIIEDPVIPCQTAQEICNADAECSMAFDYYWKLCKAMFHGKKCTPKCRNSINILRSREKAQKLKMCKCDGTEEYSCHSIQRNMEKLCFHSPHHHYNITGKPYEDTPQVILTSVGVRTTLSLNALLVTLLVLWTR
ncbi:growth arrest-specific protein 1-like [Euwallacea similis]|uniref:growth arrest-specific protein 1-like n=1 Tax=Euwallacea similis TaxID=1736056 RepID=UPI00344FFB25